MHILDSSSFMNPNFLEHVLHAAVAGNGEILNMYVCVLYSVICSVVFYWTNQRSGNLISNTFKLLDPEFGFILICTLIVPDRF